MATKSSAARFLAKSTAWDRLWARWIRRTPETAPAILRAARSWSTRYGEPLPAVMRAA